MWTRKFLHLVFSAQNLWQYVRQNFANKTLSQDDLLEQNEATACDFSDNDSEFSYSDLINEYTSSKTEKSDLSSPESPTNEENISKTKSNTTTTTEWDEFENFDGVLVVPRRFVVKWAAQLLLALEKLHSLGVICW